MHKCCVILVLFISVVVSMNCDARVTGFSIHPESHDFGTVNLGDKQLMHFRVKNLSNETYIITKIQLMGVSASNFRITAGYAVPKYMQPQGYLIISVEYEPRNAGLHVAFIQITHTGAKINERINLLGSGFPVARMNINSENIDFGTVYVTRSGVEEIVIENVGTARLIVSSLNFENPAATEFSIKSGGSIPIMINPSEIHTIEVEMTPPTDGRYNNVLLISHNAVDRNSPVRVILHGEGVTYAPEIKFNETSPWDIGTYYTLAPSIIDLEITSDGIDPLTVTSASFVTATNYSIDEVLNNGGNVVNLPQIIPVGDKITIKIKFAPIANAVYNDTLTIVHDAINEPTPYDFEIKGEGRVAIIKTFNYTGTVVNWTVPAGVTSVRIEAWGAEGGENIVLTNQAGKGARMRGDFTVTPGETLKIIVGQRGYKATRGNTANGAGGGGGGSFVWRGNAPTYPMIGAGAGGGSCLTNNGLPHYQGKNAVITEAATGSRSHDQYQNSPGGTGGNDGKTVTQSGGKGWSTIKTNPAGGTGAYYGGNGGYGGGGANGLPGPGNYGHCAGGAGGYSGGGAGGTSYYYGGGGGGSYNAGTSKDDTAGVQQGNGEVKITY